MIDFSAHTWSASEPQRRIPAELPVGLAGDEWPGRLILVVGLAALFASGAVLTLGLWMVASHEAQVVIPGATVAGKSGSVQVDQAYAEAMGRYTFDLLHNWNATNVEGRTEKIQAIFNEEGARQIKERLSERKTVAAALDLAQSGSLLSVTAVPIGSAKFLVTWEGRIETYYGSSRGAAQLVTESAVFMVAAPTPQREMLLMGIGLTRVATTTAPSNPISPGPQPGPATSSVGVQ